MKSIADVIGKTPEEVEAALNKFMAPENVGGVCKRCQRQVDYLAPAGYCEDCLGVEDRKRAFLAKVDRLPQALQRARMEDLANTYPNGDTVTGLDRLKIELTQARINRRSVYLHGAPGSGKTTLMAAVYVQMARAGLDVWWMDGKSYFDQIKAAYKSGAGDAEVVDRLVWYATHGALFLDDLGTKAPGGWALEMTEALVHRLYENRGSACVWISSNFSLEQLIHRLRAPQEGAGAQEEAIAEMIVERVISRMVEMMTVAQSPARNWRLER